MEQFGHCSMPPTKDDITILGDICGHRREHETEECGIQHIALLISAVTRKIPLFRHCPELQEACPQVIVSQTRRIAPD